MRSSLFPALFKPLAKSRAYWTENGQGDPFLRLPQSPDSQLKEKSRLLASQVENIDEFQIRLAGSSCPGIDSEQGKPTGAFHENLGYRAISPSTAPQSAFGDGQGEEPGGWSVSDTAAELDVFLEHQTWTADLLNLV
jgi:hypothetical protein